MQIAKSTSVFIANCQGSVTLHPIAPNGAEAGGERIPCPSGSNPIQPGQTISEDDNADSEDHEYPA
jgi:hypothetical protein